MQRQEPLADLLEALAGRYYGKYRGIVVNNTDPTRRGRLEVLVPAVMGDQPVWALPCAPYGGANVGLYMIPEPDTGVWVEFEAGDSSYPIWVGCYWGDGQVPNNEHGVKATPPLKMIRSQKGLIITLDDEQQAITLSDSDGSNLVTIEVQNGKVTIKGTQRVVVDAPQVELVENATHPVVFGDQLLAYLNRLVAAYQVHTHGPGGTSVPTVPLPPATPDLISTTVRTG
jgi:uncharacterized protein involved in type VI secretion and phage assembly